MPAPDPTIPSSDRNKKPFAWGGVTLAIPQKWETGQLGHGYALLEHQMRPVLELKTATIRGRFSFRRHLKQLTRSGPKHPSPRLQLMPLPSAWPVFPDTTEVQPFIWQGAHIGGQGLMVFCHHCRRATLIQFFDHGGRSQVCIPQVLASFKDHDAHPSPTFAVYDIQATLPPRFALTRFQFDAGRFELAFHHARETVTLWRWSPADVILDRCDGNLVRLSQDNDLLPPNADIEPDRTIDRGLMWQWHKKDFRSRLRNLFTHRENHPVHALRIWHLSDSNRILAVRAEGLTASNVLDRICASYGTI